MNGFSPPHRRRLRAFTLIELMVILAILSILIFIVTPRFVSYVNPERTKNFVLGIQNTLNYLNEKAILEKRIYLFHFDLDERRYYFTISEGEDTSVEVGDRYLKSKVFPEKLRVERVRVVPGDEVYDGEIAVPFTPNGMLFSFQIFFAAQKEIFYVLTGNSVNNRIELVKIGSDEYRELID